jgi:hypothetical protein
MIASAVLAAAVAGVGVWSGPAFGQAQNAAAEKAKRADQTNVPVKVVVLFSSGVGYFEHAGAVTGNASSELRFKTQQINDILKSLVLQDMGGGRVTTVVYPSQDPIEKTLRSFQVDITGDPSLAELLSQLRGAKVQLTLGGEQVGGTILGLEKKPKAVGGKDENGEPKAIETWWINLISGGTIRSIELADARKIDLEDPQLQEELSQALTALAQARDQDKKPVTIQFSGQGERQVRIGYVVETPIWKTSYRLVLPGQGAAGEKKEGQPEQAAADKPKLVGWAIVENQTDNDWNNVQLSLVSGRPISFIQNLYSPLYVPRPVVQPELYASLRPQTYDAGMEGVERLAEAEANTPADRPGRQRAQRTPAAAAPTAGAAFENAPSFSLQAGVGGGGGRGGGGVDDQRADNFAASVASVASASKVGELFQYTVGNVSLPRQRSAMIPIVTDDIEVEKLSIYNQSVLARHPLNGARVKNTTGKHLLQGPITVLEGSGYAGDARIDNVPPGQERLISYGIDLQMLVDAKNHKSEAAVVAGKIVKGVLWVTRKNVASQEYHAENKSDKDKTLVIEHPLRGGWTLVEPGKPAEKTETLYRFRQGVAAGKQAVVRVVEENVASQQIAILPQDVGALEMYARTDKIPKEVRDALSKAIGMKNAMAGTQRQIERRKKELAEITQEQTRIRENLKTVARDNEYADRLLKKLNEQESRIEALQKEADDLQKTFEAQRKELEDYLAATTIGQ